MFLSQDWKISQAKEVYQPFNIHYLVNILINMVQGAIKHFPFTHTHPLILSCLLDNK